jgi:lipopolysaccharide O-acetyltransferase
MKATVKQPPAIKYNRYGLVHFLWLLVCLLWTKIFFKDSRLIRLPIFLRGRSQIRFGSGLTSGYFARLDAFGETGCIEFGHDVQFNDFVHIGALKQVKIGNNVLIASRVFITDHDHGCYSGKIDESDPSIAPAARQIHARPVIIEDNVWIGEKVSILPGTHIGEGSIIGAGSVVKGRIPPHSIAVGVPARVIKRFDSTLGHWVRCDNL